MNENVRVFDRCTNTKWHARCAEQIKKRGEKRTRVAKVHGQWRNIEMGNEGPVRRSRGVEARGETMAGIGNTGWLKGTRRKRKG